MLENMSNHLPPLKAIQAFEASARLGSFTRAAEELGVTSAAVGQQVRSLEALLNVTLFHRNPEGLEKTQRAEAALKTLSQGFDNISEAVRILSSETQDTKLRLSVSPSFGSEWLAPRLPRFYAQHPGIEVEVESNFELRNIARGEVDIAIRFGAGRYTGLKTERIMQECILPLCSPALRDRFGLRQIGDLSGVPLVHVVNQTSDRTWLGWQDWAERHGLDPSGFARGPVFMRSGIAMALRSAAEGQGVALSSGVCAEADLASGRLVAPFGRTGAGETQFGYDLVFSAALAETRPVAAFRSWARAEGMRTGETLAQTLR